MSNFDAFNNFGTQFGFNTQANQNQNPQNQNMMIGFNNQAQNQQPQQGFQNQFNTQQQPNMFSQFDGFGGNGQMQPQQQNQQQQQPFMNSQMGQQQPQNQIVPYGQNMMLGFNQNQQQPPMNQMQMNQFGQMPGNGQQMQGMDQFGNHMPQQMPGQVQFEAPKPLKLKVKLENSERGVYSALYSQIDPEETNSIKQDKVMEFFNRANLNQQIIQNIWSICIPEGDTMDKENFYVALRLIAYAQNNVEVSSQSIYQNIKAPANPKFAPKAQAPQQPAIPPQDLSGSLGGMGFGGGMPGQQMNSGSQQMPNQGQGMQQFGQPNMQMQQQQQFGQTQQQQQQTSQYAITPPLYQKYEQYFDATDTKKVGRIDGSQAKDIFSKSKLPNESLKLIWKLSDTEKKGFLTKFQFCIMVHLVYLTKKGIQVPQTLPPELIRFLQTNGQSVFQQVNEMPQQNQMQNNVQMNNQQIQQQPQQPIHQNTMDSFSFNTNQLTPPQQQGGLSQSPSQTSVGQFNQVQNSNQTPVNNQPMKTDAFNTMDLLNQAPAPILAPPAQDHKNNYSSFDLMDSQKTGGLTTQLNNMNISDFSALNNMPSQPIQQQPIQQQAIQQQPLQQQQPQPSSAFNSMGGGVSMQQNKDFENNFQAQQNKLNHIFEETRATHTNFIEQQKQQLDIFNQIIEAYTKTNQKFQDENEVLKEEIKNIFEKQQQAISKLHEIGRNFHSNLQNNKQLRQEVIETASYSINAITNKASETLQQNGSQDHSYTGGYHGNGQDNYGHQQDHSGFNNNQGYDNNNNNYNNAGFDISSQFQNNQSTDHGQQQQWGQGFDNNNHNNSYGGQTNANNAQW